MSRTQLAGVAGALALVTAVALQGVGSADPLPDDGGPCAGPRCAGVLPAVDHHLTTWIAAVRPAVPRRSPRDPLPDKGGDHPTTTATTTGTWPTSIWTPPLSTTYTTSGTGVTTTITAVTTGTSAATTTTTADHVGVTSAGTSPDAASGTSSNTPKGARETKRSASSAHTSSAHPSSAHTDDRLASTGVDTPTAVLSGALLLLAGGLALFAGRKRRT